MVKKISILKQLGIKGVLAIKPMKRKGQGMVKNGLVNELAFFGGEGKLIENLGKSLADELGFKEKIFERSGMIESMEIMEIGASLEKVQVHFFSLIWRKERPKQSHIGSDVSSMLKAVEFIWSVSHLPGNELFDNVEGFLFHGGI